MDAIILMAGKGTRLNAGTNKVLLDLNGKPIFMYSVELLKKYVEKIILVISPNDEDFIRPYLDDNIVIAYGGAERYLSVYNGVLKANSDMVLIHDGARPNVNPLKLEQLIKLSTHYDALMLAQTEKNTVYSFREDQLKQEDRNKLILAETPQIVNRNLYLQSVALAQKDNFIPTDDISLLLHLDNSLKIKYIIDEENFKITTKLDLALARMVIKND